MMSKATVLNCIGRTLKTHCSKNWNWEGIAQKQVGLLFLWVSKDSVGQKLHFSMKKIRLKC